MDWATANGEPNDNRNSQNCIGLWGGGGWKWGDYPCSSSIGYICEKYIA